MKTNYFIFIVALGAFLFAETASYANTRQGNYRWRADDGNEANATFLAAQNTSISIGDYSNIRLRVELYNSSNEQASVAYSLFYRKSTSSSWTKVTTSTSNDFSLSLTPHFSDRQSTSSNLLSDNESHDSSGQLIESSENTSNLTVVFKTSTEFEFSIRMNSSAEVGTYEFTVRKVSGFELDNGYDRIPTLTVTNVPPEPQLLVGEGTQSNPYQISSVTQLNYIRNFPSAHFIQTNDIDMDTTGFNSGSGWEPIGVNSRGSEFEGYYDGNGYTIKNLYINRPSDNFVGLFGVTFGGQVKNVALEDVDITAGSFTGALVGLSYSDVLNSYATGTVSAANHSGGLVGTIEDYLTSTAEVTDSYSLVDLTSSGGNFGGLVGRMISGEVNTSYSAGLVSGGTDANGGLVGLKQSGTVTNSYWDTETSGQTVSDGGTGLTTAASKQQSNYTGFDFGDTWMTIDGVERPMLQVFGYKKTGITGTEGWRLLTAPSGDLSYGEMLDTLWTQGFSGADATNGSPNVLTWNEATRSWTAPSSASEKPVTGTGFLVYVFSDDNGPDGAAATGFPKVLTNDSTQFSGTATPSLNFTDSGTPANDGWNLMGNPYGASIDWDGANGWNRTNVDGTFYVWSDSAGGGTGAYLSWNGATGTLENGKIAPWQGFWVKANASSPSMSLNDSTRSTGGTLFKKNPVPQIDLILSGNSISNKALVMFHELANEGKDVFDAYKLNSLNSDYLLIGTRNRNLESMDIQALPMEGEFHELDIDMKGNNLNGEFTLGWNTQALPNDWQLTLVDRFEDRTYPMNQNSSITFSLSEKSKQSDLNVSESKILKTPSSPIQTLEKSKVGTTRFALKIEQKASVNYALDQDLPTEVSLNQNYPNPFNPTTTISFALPENSKVTLEVFDVMGRKVATLLEGNQRSAGSHTVNFDASSLSSGMYLYRLAAGNTVITRKLTLIK